MISGFKTSARFSRMRSNRSFAVNSIATEYDTCERRERESWWDGGMVFSGGTGGITFDPNVNFESEGGGVRSKVAEPLICNYTPITM